MHENSCVRLAQPTALNSFNAQPYHPKGRCLVVSQIELLEQHNQPAMAGSFVFFQMTKLQTLRKSAFKAQNGCCFYCGLPMWEGSDQATFASRFKLSKKLIPLCQSTAEHLHAQQDGGKDVRENITAACKYCNVRRHQGRADNAPSPEQYRARIQRLIAQGKWHPALAALTANGDANRGQHISRAKRSAPAACSCDLVNGIPFNQAIACLCESAPSRR